MSDPVAVQEPLADREARERFRVEWRRNFAVSANAGSGKTTAISERLAAMALDPEGGPELRRTAVVTYTLKAAEEIGARARERLLKRLEERGAEADLSPLEHLERAFFGTLHSFCLKLAREHGHEAGLDLAPKVLDARAAEAAWEDFLAGDPLTLASLTPEAARWLFRLVRLDDVLDQARELEPGEASALRARAPRGLPARPDGDRLAELLALPEKGAPKVRENLRKTKELATGWMARAQRGGETEFLGVFKPAGSAGASKEAARRWMAPLVEWAAAAAGAAAGEIAERFAAWRRAASVQTFADQVAAARELLGHPRTLAAARAAGWRVILDEAQDTDEAQFSILAELARPADAKPGTWPGGGAPPLPGRFCLVGDGQQSIYSSRASVRTFRRYLAAFDGGPAGDRLHFEVTFRAPRALVELLNTTLPGAFSPDREHNRGLPPTDGAPAPVLQVEYQPLVAAPGAHEGRVARIPLAGIGGASRTEQLDTFREEMRQVAGWLASRGPAGLGLAGWGELCILVARNKWMDETVRALEAAGLKAARQSKQQELGDQPAYAWMAALTAVCCAPDDDYEWFGVLRELFGVEDSLLAREKLRRGRYEWENPDAHPEPLRAALAKLRPCVESVDDEAVQLDLWCEILVGSCGLEAKARAADAGGATLRELARLRAEARSGAVEGLSPRAWASRLALNRRAGRAENRSEPDAITVQTCHSAKGLEWPAVLVPGFWREIGFDHGRGLQILRDGGGAPVAYLKADDVPDDTKRARDRERRRELVRLLYVTLTRPRRILILPWDPAVNVPHPQSFAAMWNHSPGDLVEWGDLNEGTGAENTLRPKPIEPVRRLDEQGGRAGDVTAASERILTRFSVVMADWPLRLLPHELAEHEPDVPRVAKHEASADRGDLAGATTDPIAYGLWWHETLEFMPWLASDAAVVSHGEERCAAADQAGFGDRARSEWALFLQGTAWRELRSSRWSRLSELSVLAPLENEGWMDGVMDLVLHDARTRQAWVLDWKTNRRRFGETEREFQDRIIREYAPQLKAYGRSLAAMFPGCEIRCLIYCTGTGFLVEVSK